MVRLWEHVVPALLTEKTLVMHDLMHQLIPDPVYCGEDSDVIVHMYTLLRTLSETITLVLADCLFVECMMQVLTLSR